MERVPAAPSSRAFTLVSSCVFAILLSAACGGGDGGDAGDARGGEGRRAGARSAAPPPVRATAPDAIAYVGADGRELRLVQPDGSGGRLVWKEADTMYSVAAPAWRPDGGEIAFTSNHEMAVSLYERDVYAVAPDGSGLRRITNPPAHPELASRPKARSPSPCRAPPWTQARSSSTSPARPGRSRSRSRWGWGRS